MAKLKVVHHRHVGEHVHVVKHRPKHLNRTRRAFAMRRGRAR